jgi:hypothetical protein
MTPSPMTGAARRFPLPWRAEPIPGGYIVRDANGQAHAYLYSRDNPAEALPGAARRIATNIVRPPELLGTNTARASRRTTRQR